MSWRNEEVVAGGKAGLINWPGALNVLSNRALACSVVQPKHLYSAVFSGPTKAFV